MLMSLLHVHSALVTFPLKQASSMTLEAQLLNIGAVQLRADSHVSGVGWCISCSGKSTIAAEKDSHGSIARWSWRAPIAAAAAKEARMQGNRMVESMMSDKVDEDVFNVKWNGEEGRGKAD
jgi:hypothetical protein